MNSFEQWLEESPRFRPVVVTPSISPRKVAGLARLLNPQSMPHEVRKVISRIVKDGAIRLGRFYAYGKGPTWIGLDGEGKPAYFERGQPQRQALYSDMRGWHK